MHHVVGVAGRWGEIRFVAVSMSNMTCREIRCSESCRAYGVRCGCREWGEVGPVRDAVWEKRVQ